MLSRTAIVDDFMAIRAARSAFAVHRGLRGRSTKGDLPALLREIEEIDHAWSEEEEDRLRDRLDEIVSVFRETVAPDLCGAVAQVEVDEWHAPIVRRLGEFLRGLAANVADGGKGVQR